ncbi:uncharacterized protein [Triticum aestivum]|uniref:uncharacterized protein n=1 Tax=Triticum aestivum TaxID=4565 RepID=UPI001D0227B0|nr:uncharacterized protein LOC123040662 [Triticum aestivum]
MVKQIQQKSEATISQFESEMADLKNRLAAQELEIQKANSKFEFSVSEQEKLKKNFEAEKKIWADEKASLVTRAETAEALLAEATTELSDLKRQISQMVSAIFGPRSTNLKQNMLIKLKAVYTLVEKLYIASRALAVVALSDDVPHLLQYLLKWLASLPQRIQDLRRASARAEAVAVLSRAKAWIPELDQADLALGYPSLKEDGTVFDGHDFTAYVKVIRPVATLIGNDTDLTKYQPGYDQENRRILAPPFDEVSLIPPTRKHTFAPEVDPASLIDDEAEFEALSGIDWASSTFQDKAADKEAEKDNPEHSSPPKDETPGVYDFAKQCFIIQTRGVL